MEMVDAFFLFHDKMTTFNYTICIHSLFDGSFYFYSAQSECIGRNKENSFQFYLFGHKKAVTQIVIFFTVWMKMEKSFFFILNSAHQIDNNDDSKATVDIYLVNHVNSSC